MSAADVSRSQECCNFTHIKRNGIDGTSYPLVKNSNIVLGRDANCDFRVQLPSVSNKHANLRVDKTGKVYVTSLCNNAPVLLNNKAVMEEVLIPNTSVISIGSCSFRFDYREGVFSPLREENHTPREKATKSPKTPASAKKGKENSATPKVFLKMPQKATPKTPLSGEKTTPKKVATPRGVPAHTNPKSPLVYKKTPGKTPEVTPKANMSKWTPKLTMKRTPTPSKSFQKTPSFLLHKKEKALTPIPPRERSFTRRSSRLSSLTSTSLMSIPEVDELTSNTPSPASSRKRSFHHIPTLDASLVSTYTGPPKKRSRKSVTFGPSLSPEYFDKRLPPSTPIKCGILPVGLRRSLPAGFIMSEAVLEESYSDEDESEYTMTFEDSFDSTSSSDTSSSSGEDYTFEFSPTKPPFLPTPIRVDIQNKPPLKSMKKKLATPVRREIQSRPTLKATKKGLVTPVRKEIESKPVLRKTRKTLSTPIRHGIKNHPALRKTRYSMPTPLQKDIRAVYLLRKTKKSMPTPVRKDIEGKPSLQKTKKSMPTPVRKDIEGKPSLRKTKKSMPTPVRKDIEGKPSLRKTKKSMPTPVRKDIEGKPSLRKTKKSMPTPVRKDIEGKPSLRKTKKSMPTPVRWEIEGKPSLQKTKLSMSTPLRKEIESKPALRKTKKSLPTPLKNSIKSKPALKKTKKSLPSPLRLAIAAKPILRKTKRTLPTPIRDAIKQKPGLRATKRSLPSPLITQILSKPSLRKSKPTLATPLREEIKAGISLRATKRTLPAEMIAEIKSKPELRHVPLHRPIKRAISDTVTGNDTPVHAPPAKRQRIAAVASPSPYNFRHFSAKSPNMEFTGIQMLFRSPKVNYSADPAEMFETKLFEWSSNVIRFASPLAYTAKKPVGPLRKEPMPSRLKNANDIPVFDIEVKPATRRSTRRKTTATTGTRRSTRAKATTSNKQSARLTGSKVEVAVPQSSSPEKTEVMTRATKSRTKQAKPEPMTKQTVVTVQEPEVVIAHVTRSRRGGKPEAEVVVTRSGTVTEEAPSRTTRSKESTASTSEHEEIVVATRRATRSTARKSSAVPKTEQPPPEPIEPAVVTKVTRTTSRKGNAKTEQPPPEPIEAAVVTKAARTTRKGNAKTEQPPPEPIEAAVVTKAARTTRKGNAKTEQPPPEPIEAAVVTKATRTTSRKGNAKTEQPPPEPVASRRSARLRGKN